MRVKESSLVIASLVAFALLEILSSLSIVESFILALQLYTFLRFINNIGSTICFFDFLMFYSVMDTLVLPIVGYRIFNYQNPLSNLWGAYMKVPEEEYFTYMIPANLAFFVGMNQLSKKRYFIDHRKFIDNIVKYSAGKGTIGIVLTLIGLFATLFLDAVPASFAHILFLFSMLKYVGPLYIYFSKFEFKTTALIIALVLFFAQSVFQGMFGDFFMYSILIMILVSLKFRVRFVTKVLSAVGALILVLVLQSIKGTFRQITWSNKSVQGVSLENSSHYEVFGDLMLNRVNDLNSIMDENVSFNLYRRFNQGQMISSTMNYVPRVEPYANGSTLLRSLGAIIVPRFLWPDKPEAGGRENLSRFMGVKRKLKYSMNIGPYGEAYGNFGPVIGIGFIFLYGVFLSFLLNIIIKRTATTSPSYFLWLPLLFYYTLTVETDIMTTINSFFKAYIFILILYWFTKKYIKTSL